VVAGQTSIDSPTSEIHVSGGSYATGTLSSNDYGTGIITLFDSPGGTALSINGASGSGIYYGSISGDGSVAKSGGSTQTFAGANTYTGTTTVNGGTLILASGASSSYTANNGGALSLNFGNFGFSTLRANAGGTIQYNVQKVIGGFLRGAGTHNIDSVNSFNGTTFGGDVALTQNARLTLNNVNNSGNFNSNASLIWDGGSNTSAGSVNVNAAMTVSAFENNGAITVNSGGALTGSATKLVSGGGSRMTINPGGQVILSGVSLDLNGALLVNNGTMTGTTNVNFGSLAKGGGTFGAVNVTDGGKFSPGNSPGAATTGSTSWGAGGGYLFEINDAAGTAGANWDLWNINGGLSITAGTTNNSRFTISIASLTGGNAPGTAANFNAAQNYSWLIASTTAGITGFDTSKFTIDPSAFTNPISGGTFSLNQTGNNLFLNFNGVSGPPQWNVDASGSWGVMGNWQPAVVPNGATATASFLGKITAPRTVTLDGDKTVGAIYFDNANAYTIAPGSGGTLTVLGGVDATGFNIQASTGNHIISAPLLIAGSMGMSARPGASLTISGPFSIADGMDLNGSGVITISGTQNHGEKTTYNTEGVGLTTFASNAGTPATATTAAIHNLALSIGANASMTFTANQNIRDLGLATSDGPEHVNLASPGGIGAFRAIHVYADDLAGAKAALYASLANANRPGAPDPTVGIFDSGRGLHPNSGIGIAIVNDAHGDANVFIRLTRIGDLNLDGVVSISDFIDLASHFNGPGTWQEGDLNYDGQVTISDFIDLASNFNTSYSGEVFPISPEDQKTLADFAAAVGDGNVPEPTVGCLVLLAGGLIRRRGRTWTPKAQSLQIFIQIY